MLIHSVLCPQVLSHSLLYCLTTQGISDLAVDHVAPDAMASPAGEAAQCIIGLRWAEVRRNFPAPRRLLFCFSSALEIKANLGPQALRRPFRIGRGVGQL